MIIACNIFKKIILYDWLIIASSRSTIFQSYRDFHVCIFSSPERKGHHNLSTVRPSVLLLTFPLDDFSRTTWPISTKVDGKHVWGMGIHQICSNKGDDPFWGKIWKILINIKISSHEPLSRMHWYLAWNTLGARRFNFVQMKSLATLRGHIFISV